jgi:hypothetical protein
VGQDNLGLGLLQKDDISVGVASQDAEILPIRRPAKGQDLFGIEFGNLAAGGAI